MLADRTFIIRALMPDDSISLLTQLIHRAYAEHGARGLHYVAVDQDEQTTAQRAAGGECFIAVDPSGPIVGTITVADPTRTEGSPWYDRPEVASFSQFAVDPAWQGAGVGRALLETAERRARESGARELACDTAQPATELIAMYEHLGYRVVGTVDWRPVTNYLSVTLSKDLSKNLA